MVSVSKTVDCVVVLVFPLLPPLSLLFPLALSRRCMACGHRRCGFGTIAEMVVRPSKLWINEGAVVALDPTSATPLELFPFPSPKAATGKLFMAISFWPVAVGRVGDGLEGKVNCHLVGRSPRLLRCG